uniref:Uncharacterized protein n=1 Tax=Pelusios castaneus TaxID=367368 RepID=A0A8C8S8J0_9SAUR
VGLGPRGCCWSEISLAASTFKVGFQATFSTTILPSPEEGHFSNQPAIQVTANYWNCLNIFIAKSGVCLSGFTIKCAQRCVSWLKTYPSKTLLVEGAWKKPYMDVVCHLTLKVESKTPERKRNILKGGDILPFSLSSTSIYNHHLANVALGPPSKCRTSGSLW